MPDLPRSYLFVPGDRPERFEKAVASGADCPVLDLEDAVLPEAKEKARSLVREWLQLGGRAAVRINSIGTKWHSDDLELAALPGVMAIMLPKAEAQDQIDAMASALPAGVPLIPIIESAAGLLDARAVAALPGVQRLAFGSVDYGNDVGISAEDDLALLFARSTIVVASAAAGIGEPVDGVTLALADERRLCADVELARRLGMGGKLCIHPQQVATVNAGFAPTSEEVAVARRIVAAAQASGAHGAIQLDNKMIDRPIIERSIRILARVDRSEAT
jgi:citrate lyase subunit beta / citryl-CoA lyase